MYRMKNGKKTKQQLMDELAELRGRIAELERKETERKLVEEMLKKERATLENIADHLQSVSVIQD